MVPEKVLLLLLSLATLIHSQTARRGIQPDSLPLWSPSQSPQTPVETTSPADSVTHSLTATGSKSIQVRLGEGGTDVGQELRLSIQGEAAPGVHVDARLTDVGRAEGDQVTATLQEVDEMYFRLQGRYGYLQLGNQNAILDRLGLIGLQRSTMGVSAGINGHAAQISGLYGVDESEHMVTVFSGNAGQRTGYVLAPGQSSFLVVVPGSVQVFWNGTQLQRDVDYQINEAGGVLDFLGTRLPSPSDEIRVEFDVYRKGSMQELRMAEAAYRSSHLWLDLAGFQLAADTSRLQRAFWSDAEQQRLRNDRGEEAVAGDSSVLERPASLQRLGARLRILDGTTWFLDAEAAWSRKDTNMLSDAVQGPQGRAFRWEISSDSSYAQKGGFLRMDLRGDLREAGFVTPDFQGKSRDWDSYVLQEYWDLDSTQLTGGLRWDEASLRLRLPGGWFPGWYQGYRRSASSNEDWNSLRSRGFLQHRSKGAVSEMAVERVSSVQDARSSDRWQGETMVTYTEGDWRPFAEARIAVWDRTTEKDTLIRGRSGLEWGRQGSPGFARGELLGERHDTLQVAQWTQNGEWRGAGWNLKNLLQYRREQHDSLGKSDTWLWENTGTWGPRNSPWTGEFGYDLGFTNEIPWIRLYEAVPSGTGDVLYDSLAGEYIEGVDNGDYIFIGMGRPDSAAAVRTAHVNLRLGLELALGPLLRIQHGFLAGTRLGVRGDWEAWDSSRSVRFTPPILRSQLRDRDQGTASVEGTLSWLHAGGLGSAELRRGETDEKQSGSYGLWQEKRWWHAESRYTGREKETWTVSGKLEEISRHSVLDMEWEIREAGLSWRRELPWNLALEPSGRRRWSEGGDGFDSYAAELLQGGITCYWTDMKGNSVRVGGTWTRMDAEASVLPYAVMEGFGRGQTWRGEALLLFSAQENFLFSLGYTIRGGDAEPRLFQKFTSEAKALF